MTKEIWKPVVGFEGAYEVSNRGRVRSLGRVKLVFGRSTVRHAYLVPGKMLSPAPRANGYLVAGLSKDGLQHQRLVAHLVAEAFLGPRPEGMQVCHSNGVRGDNRLANLRYDTPTSNAADKRLHGTHLAGEQLGHAKLDVNAVREIRASCEVARILADKFGVHHSSISNVRRGATWAHVK